MSIQQIKFLLLLGIALLVSACSRIDLAVKWADTYTLSKIDDYFDISSQQKRDLEKDVDAAIIDIRKEMFPSYGNYFNSVRTGLIAAGTDREQVTKVIVDQRKQLEEILAVSMQKLGPRINSALSVLDRENWNSFFEEFEKKNNEISRKHNDRAKTTIEGIEGWTGRLNSEQRDKIRNFSQKHPFPTSYRVKNRTHHLNHFVKKGDPQGGDLDRTQKTVESWISSYKDYHLPEYQDAMRIYSAQASPFFADLYLGLTPAQKDKLFSNLKARAEAFQKLSL